MQVTWVQSLVWEDPVVNGTHSSILAWRIPWTEKPGLQRVRHSWLTGTFTFFTEMSRLCLLHWTWPC